MSSDAFHKILEPYLFATGLMVLILLAAVFFLHRHGRAMRDAAAQAPPVPPSRKPRARRAAQRASD